MLISIFSRLTRKDTVNEKLASNDSDAYIYLLFPMTVAFLITFAGSRLISRLDPLFFLHIVPGLHIHHYLYGVLVLAISGYLGLAAMTPRNRYLVSLLHGFGLGLAFDEFGFLLHLSDLSVNRFSYDGVLVLLGLFLLLVSAEKGARMWRLYFPKKGSRRAQD